jgi:flavin prenyltransferase
MSGEPKRMIVGISGASGAIYGVRMLEQLRAVGVETHLVISKPAVQTVTHECGLSITDLKSLATDVHSNADIGASIASGSFKTAGMVVAPCSVKSMSEIATGLTTTLLARAADVVLKERRRLVLMLRETPLHLGHVRTMAQVTEAGAILYPPVPAFYQKPQTIDDMVDHTVGRVLDLFDIETGTVNRWHGLGHPPQ